MWPLGHLAVAYLLYAAGCRWRGQVRPDGAAVVAAAFGALFPDLVDKPLAWYLGVLPGGRTLAHSLVVAALLLPAVYWVAARYRRRELGVAFAVGHLSHAAADAYLPLVTGEYADLAFLVWPLAPLPPDTNPDRRLLEMLASVELTWPIVLEFVLAAVALAVWHRQGRPGLATVHLAVRRAVRGRQVAR